MFAIRLLYYCYIVWCYLFLDSSMFFIMWHNYVTVTVMCDVILTPNFKFQNKKKKKENRNEKELKIIRAHYSQF